MCWLLLLYGNQVRSISKTVTLSSVIRCSGFKLLKRFSSGRDRNDKSEHGMIKKKREMGCRGEERERRHPGEVASH